MEGKKKQRGEKGWGRQGWRLLCQTQSQVHRFFIAHISCPHQMALTLSEIFFLLDGSTSPFTFNLGRCTSGAPDIPHRRRNLFPMDGRHFNPFCVDGCSRKTSDEILIKGKTGRRTEVLTLINTGYHKIVRYVLNIYISRSNKYITKYMKVCTEHPILIFYLHIYFSKFKLYKQAFQEGLISFEWKNIYYSKFSDRLRSLLKKISFHIKKVKSNGDTLKWINMYFTYKS